MPRARHQKTRIQLNFFNRILIKIQANKNLPFFDVNNLLSLVIPSDSAQGDKE